MRREFQFEAHPEKGKVSAVLIKPKDAKSLVVLGHGAGAGMYHSNMDSIAQSLFERSIATLRYQFPFMERGGGRDSEKVSLATVASAVIFAKSLARRFKSLKGLPIFAGGHSFGGRMTSLAAADSMLGELDGLIFFAFPLHAPNKPSNHRAEHLSKIPVPMLFLSGSRDSLMDLDLFRPVLKKIRKTAKLHVIDTANHGYKVLKKIRNNSESVFDEMGDVVDRWIRDLN
ncbi:MAG: alpha/beta family hydrolase [Planctomycetota bacterium]